MRKHLIATLALTAVLAASLAHAVVINEFYYGTAAPGNNEWIELYNLSGMNINLTSWTLNVANNAGFVQRHQITSGRPDTMIQSNSYFLVTDGAGTGEEDVNGVNLDMGRATGTVVYGLALVDDGGTTIDTVLYAPGGATNVYNLVDDDGYTSLARVLLVVGDESYTRDQFHTDTNVSLDDFSGTLGGGTPVPVEISRFELE